MEMSKYTCFARVSADGWHWHKCGKPAKVAFLHKGRDKATPYCGIHARMYRGKEGHQEIQLPTEGKA